MSDLTAQAVMYRSDKAEGPTAGPETVDPLDGDDRGGGFGHSGRR